MATGLLLFLVSAPDTLRAQGYDQAIALEGISAVAVGVQQFEQCKLLGLDSAATRVLLELTLRRAGIRVDSVSRARVWLRIGCVPIARADDQSGFAVQVMVEVRNWMVPLDSTRKSEPVNAIVWSTAEMSVQPGQRGDPALHAWAEVSITSQLRILENDWLRVNARR